jgi:VWFA-related protein
MGLARTAPLLCLLLLPSALFAQNASAPPASSPAPATTLSVDVKVVTLPVTVRDKKGKIVKNLTKDDFVLEEDGKPQTVRYFNLETNLPLTVGLLVDTSMSERDNLDKERAASRTFLDQMITTPKDRAFVIHFDREIELLQDLTNDHGKLEKAVGEIDAQSAVESVPANDQGSGGGRRSHGGGGTKLYDAIFLACDEVMKKQAGRKAIVVLTDGEDRGSQETLNSAIESAQRSETIVYTIYYGGHEDHDRGFSQGGPDDDPYGRGGYPGRRYPGGGYPGGGYPGGGDPGGSRYPRQQSGPDGKKTLQRIAQETGGRYFQVSKKDSVDDVYASIAEELRTQFILGYTPPRDQSSGYHSIHLTTKNKDQEVQTRQGYFTGEEAAGK